MAGYGGEYVTIRPTVTTTLPQKRTELHLLPEQERDFVTLAQATRGITFFASRAGDERNRFMELMLEEIATSGRNVIILGEGPGISAGHFPRIPLPSHESERAETIRSVLLHDPDILVIEDATEPASFSAACQVAMGGKLVLAGLALRGMSETLNRLLIYKEQSYFLPPVVNGLLAWKDVQLLCPHCRSEFTPSAEEISLLGITTPPAFHRSSGCEQCDQSGSAGRRFLMDVIPFSGPFLQQFRHATSLTPLMNHLTTEGYRGCEEAGARLLQEGDVSPDEYIASIIL